MAKELQQDPTYESSRHAAVMHKLLYMLHGKVIRKKPYVWPYHKSQHLDKPESTKNVQVKFKLSSVTTIFKRVKGAASIKKRTPRQLLCMRVEILFSALCRCQWFRKHCTYREKRIWLHISKFWTQMTVRRGWLLQQDNDPKQTSKSIRKYFKKHNILEQPTQSTDLNITENQWEALKHMLCVQKSPTLSENLKWFTSFLRYLQRVGRWCTCHNPCENLFF